MTIEQWKSKCVAYYVTRAGLNGAEARNCADAHIENQLALHGGDPLKWDDPHQCAADDVSTWADS